MALDPALTAQLSLLASRQAAAELEPLQDTAVAEALVQLGPARAAEILQFLPAERRAHIASEVAGNQIATPVPARRFTVGNLIERAPAVFPQEAQIADVVAVLREVVRERMVIYVFVTDSERRLIGVVAFREMLFAQPEQTLGEVMLRDPFYLTPQLELFDAMHEVVLRHFPVYPVCDKQGRLLGQVRGQMLFQEQAFRISAQAGAMVGVEREERFSTPLGKAFLFRHPWLQLNLLATFGVAAVVGLFQDLLDQIVLLAVFLPVLANQCSNTGYQALAVTLRGMTLGDLGPNQALRALGRETSLGFANGAIVGVVAGAVMYMAASMQDNPSAFGLALATALAMAGGCTLSGFSGAGVPLLLKRLGADPATASGIFLATLADMVGLGIFLSFAALLVLR